MTTSYLVDSTSAYAQVAEELQGTNKTRYDFGNDIVRLDKGSGAYYYLYDGLGSVKSLANASGNLVDALLYNSDAFGYVTGTPGSTTGNSFALNGQQFDAETQLYYLRARYYDPDTARFLSQDPYEGDMENPSTLQRYAYSVSTVSKRICSEFIVLCSEL